MPINKHDKKFVNKQDDIDNTLFELDDSEPYEFPDHNWKGEWTGMPEFEQHDNKPYMCIKIRFATKEDYKEFADLIDQNLSPKTKSIWYPALDRDRVSGKRYVDSVMELE